MIRIATITVLIFVASPAPAHEAVTGWPYPTECCSNTDCRHLEDGEVEWAPEGWVYRLTGQIIPHDKVRESPDEFIHICNIGGNPYARVVDPTDGLHVDDRPCLFVPEMMGW